MAVTVTIDVPTATEVSPGVYQISVEATAVDGLTSLGTRTFSTSTSATNQAARDTVSATLAFEIVAWRESLQRMVNAAPLLTALKVNIEGRL